jgi:hypothetical protein
VLIEHGRNWFLHVDNFVYWQRPEHGALHYQFDASAERASLVSRLALALLYAVIASGIVGPGAAG